MSPSCLSAKTIGAVIPRRGLSSTSARRGVVKTFNLADIGEGITECEIIKWSIAPGAKISSFDPLCEVQSDKASVEITSPFDGVVKQLLVAEGEVCKVGGGLCLIEVDSEEGASPSEVASPPPAEAVTGEATEAAAQSLSGQSRKMHPLDPSNPAPSRSLGTRPPPRNGAAAFGMRTKDLLASIPESGADSNPTFVSGARDVLATPQVRHLAKTLGVDLALVSGTGRDGRIERSDLDQHIASLQQSSSQSVASPPTATSSEDVVVELGRTRYNMWKAMEKSLEIPHFGYSTTLDITELHNLLPTMNAHIPPRYLPTGYKLPKDSPYAQQQRLSGMVNPHALFKPAQEEEVPEHARFTKLTYLPFLLKTLGMSMMEWPLLRASITPGADPKAKPTLTVRPNPDIALALSTPSGLYTPTLSLASSSSVYALAARMKHLAHLGRQVPSQLTPREMPKRGGTVTISNVGAVGKGEVASPVLVPGGGVAICALGRAEWQMDVSEEHWDAEKGTGARRLKLPISWSADHRVVEGAELAAFVETWRGYVERPQRLVAEL